MRSHDVDMWFDLTDPPRLEFTLAWVDPNAKASKVLWSVPAAYR